MADTHLIGVGIRHVQGGEESFARGTRKVKKEAKEAAAQVEATKGMVALLKQQYEAVQPVVQAVASAVAITTTIVAASGAAALLAANHWATYEAALVGVGKTADLEGGALQALGEDIDELSRRIPVAATELLAIAQSAGQLGVQGADNILKFTETVALLGSASDLAGEQGATALARILNVSGESVSTVDVLASTIVALGNQFAATESQIARHTGEVARATAVYEIGSGASAAIATSLAAFGVQAELSGSAVGRAFRAIESAVLSGGEQMEAVAAVSRASSEEVRDAWERGPVEAFNLFLTGLREVIREGGNVAEVLKTTGLSGEEVLKVIPVLAKEYDLLARAQEVAAAEQGDASALSEEAARAFETLSSQMTVLRNRISSTVVLIGSEMAPVVTQVVTGLAEWLEKNRGLISDLARLGGQVLSTVVDLFIGLAGAIDEVVVALVALAAAWAAVRLAAMATALVEAIALWRTYNAGMTLAQLATAELSLATAGLRASLSSLGGVVAAINPLAVAVVALVGLFHLANEGIETWSNNMTAEMAEMTSAGQGLLGVMDDTEAAIRSQNEALIQSRIDQYTADLIDASTAQALAKAEVDRHTDTLGLLREEVRRQGEVQSHTKAQIEAASAALDAARQGHGEASAEVRILDEALSRLIASLDDSEAAARRQAEATAEQKKRFEEAREQIEFTTAGALSLAAAYDQSIEAGRQEQERLQVEAQLRRLAKDLTADQTKELRRLLKLQTQAQRQARGAQTLAALRLEHRELTRIAEARERGAEALAEELFALELEAQARQLAAGATAQQREQIEALVASIAQLQSEEDTSDRLEGLRAEADALIEVASAREQGAFFAQIAADAAAIDAEVRERTVGLIGQERVETEQLIRLRERLVSIGEADDFVEALEAEVDAMSELASIRKEDFLTLGAYRETIALIRQQQEVRVQLLAIEGQRQVALTNIMRDQSLGEAERLRLIAQTTQQYDELADRIRAAANEQARLGDQGDNTSTVLEEWVAAGQIVVDTVGEIDQGLARLVDSAIQLVEAFSRVSEEGGKLNATMAGAAFGQVLANELGGPDNYAAEGSMYGAVIGAIIGTILGGQTAAGAAIGSAAGGVIGSFINKGVDEFLGEVSSVALGEAQGLATKVEGDMGSVGAKFLDAISRGIQDALDMLGASLAGGADDVLNMKVKVRDGIFSVFHNGMTARFESMQEAVDFAILSALKSTELTGISDEVRSALLHSSAESFAALAEDLEFARMVEALPEVGEAASESARLINDAVEQYRAAIRKAIDLGIETAKLDQDFARQLQNIRNSILGITESNEDRIRREAEAFNREMQLLEAELLVERASLLQKQANLEAKVGLAQADLELERQGLDQRAGFIAAEAELLAIQNTAFHEAVNAHTLAVKQLLAVTNALAAVDGVLANLPDLISEGEIRDAIRRANAAGRVSTGVSSAASDREQIAETIRDLREQATQMGEGARSLSRGIENMREWITRARQLGFAEEELAQARADQLALWERDLLEPLRNASARRQGLDFTLDFGAIQAEFQDRLEQASLLAAEIGGESAEAVAAEWNRLYVEIQEGFRADVSDAFLSEVARMAGDGDILGLESLRSQLVDLFADLPPGVFTPLLEQVDQAIAAIQGAGGGLGLRLPSIADDLASELSPVQRELQDIARRFAEASVEAAQLGLGEEDLAQVRQAHAEALSGLRDSILESVQDYTDAVLGIDDTQRTLLDLQDQFSQARSDLQSVNAAGSSQDPVARHMDDLQAFVGQRFEGVVDVVWDALEALPMPADAVPIRRVGQQLSIAIERGSGGLRALSSQLDQAADNTSQLAADLALLDEAERVAIERLGTDFVGSLLDLGAAVPDEVMLEMAEAQWELARVSAVNTALALAEADAFANLSLTLEDVLDLIENASFERSTFFPQFNRPTPSPTPSGDDTSELDSFLEELNRQIQEWNRLGLGPATREALELRERFEELRDEALELGVSVGELSAAYANAREDFFDRTLAEFEDLELTPVQRQLRDTIARFDDLRDAFGELGADASQLARLESAQATAISSIWDQILEPWEGPRANDASEQLAALRQQFDDMLVAAQEYGGDLSRIEEARRRAITEFWDEALAPVLSLQDRLRGGDLAALSPAEALREAQSAFDDVVARAQAGDISAFAELDQVVEALLTEGGSFFGAGPVLERMRAEILGTVDDIADLRPEDFMEEVANGSTPPVDQWISATDVLIDLEDRLGQARLDSIRAVYDIIGVEPGAGERLTVPPPLPAAGENRGSDALLGGVRDLIDEQRSDRLDRESDRQALSDLAGAVEALADRLSEEREDRLALESKLDRLATAMEDMQRTA